MFAWLKRLVGGRGDVARRVLLSDVPALPVDHPLRKTLDERYFALRLAMASHDRQAIMHVLTPDFVSEDLDGRTSGAASMIENVTALQIDRSKRSVETTVTSIDQAGDVATVIQRYSMTTSEVSAAVPSALWTESCDVWRAVGTEWRLASTTTLAFEVVKNGRRTFRRRLQPSHGGISVELRGPAR
ncbi:MAG TPA: nuclear transport factor 2 family protein [Candidatus Elarobacter sp.]|nr:nuclear transport factor 2 family protein [Candidatus Elarobacter sp.]